MRSSSARRLASRDLEGVTEFAAGEAELLRHLVEAGHVLIAPRHHYGVLAGGEAAVPIEGERLERLLVAIGGDPQPLVRVEHVEGIGAPPPHV